MGGRRWWGLEGERGLGEGGKGKGREGKSVELKGDYNGKKCYFKKKKKNRGAKKRLFIIIVIKNIFISSINRGRLIVGTKTKTFGDIWIKTRKKKIKTKTKIIRTNIIFKLPRGKGDMSLHHPHHHLTEAN